MDELIHAGLPFTENSAMLPDRVLFEYLFEHSPDAIVLLDSRDQVIRANPEFERRFGYASNECAGRPINSLIVDPGFHEEASEISRAVCRGETVRTESLRLARDGSLLQVEITGVPIRIDGNQLGIFGIYRDVTAQRNAEDLLRQSEHKYRRIVESINDGFFEIDLNGQLLFFNPALARLVGLPGDRMARSEPRRWVARKDRRRVFRQFSDVLEGRPPESDFTWCMRRPDGSERFVESSITPVIGTNGNPTGFRGLLRDVTKRVRAARALRETELAYRTMANHTGQLVYDYRIASGKIHWQGAIQRVLGLEPGETDDYGLDRWIESVHPDDRERTVSLLDQARQRGEPFRAEYRMRGHGGGYIHVIDKGSFLTDAEGRVHRMIGTISDVTAARAQREALKNEQRQAMITLDSIGDGVIRTDAAGRVEYLNPVAETLTGWSLAGAMGQPLEHVFCVQRDGGEVAITVLINQALDGNQVKKKFGEVALVSRYGDEYDIEVSTAPILAGHAQVRGCVIVFRDVTESRRAASQIAWQAEHDALTGLYNRHKFERDAGRWISEQEGQTHVLLYMDLDQFKIVNDTCGHQAGDELLRSLARELQGRVRSSDLLARLGGDEFALLLARCPLDRARKVAESLIQTINAFSFVWEQHRFNVGISIGMVEIEPGMSLVEALRLADQACYVAKDAGRNQIQLHRDDDDVQVTRGLQMRAAVDVTDALNEGRFRLYFQKIASLGTERRAGHVEILVRMLDRSGRVVSPGLFIPGAERFGKIVQLDRWVVSSVFERLAETPSGSSPERVSINLSGATFGQPDFLDFVRDGFHRHGVDPHRIGFEITESSAISRLSEALVFIRAMREMGSKIVLDDFGSGFSSFGYLKMLPVDGLKIDGSLVRDIENSKLDEAMVRGICEIAHAAGIPCVAEHVECDRQLELLRGLGVDFAQGYLIHRPEAWIPGSSGAGDDTPGRMIRP